jgi:signal transduction histidine kinase
LARRSPIPVGLEVDLPERPPATFEAALYYIISEALTNAIKHSGASAISILIAIDRIEPREQAVESRRRLPNLHATITDDGVGGAEPTEGSGLMGAIDRVDALGGRLTLTSRSGAGTTISVRLPVAAAAEP